MIKNSWIAFRHLSMNGINLVNLKLSTREAKQDNHGNYRCTRSTEKNDYKSRFSNIVDMKT